MSNFRYVYILESMGAGAHFYVGMTDDLNARIVCHNSGSVPHTAKYRPWQIKTAIALRDSGKASALERYLKSSSGRAFVKRHL